MAYYLCICAVSLAVLVGTYLLREKLKMPVGTSMRQRAAAVACVAFLEIAGVCLLIVGMFCLSSQRWIPAVLPAVTIFCYVATAGFFRRLHPDWKAAPLFKLAALAPLLGFALVTLVLINDGDRADRANAS